MGPNESEQNEHVQEVESQRCNKNEYVQEMGPAKSNKLNMCRKSFLENKNQICAGNGPCKVKLIKYVQEIVSRKYQKRICRGNVP